MFRRTHAADSHATRSNHRTRVLLMLSLNPGRGAVIYADGGSHLLDGNAQEQIFVESGTTLEIMAGAEVQPLLNGTAVTGASGSTILVSGGLLQGTGGELGAGGLTSTYCQVEVHEGAEIRAAYSTSTYTSSALFFVGGELRLRLPDPGRDDRGGRYPAPWLLRNLRMGEPSNERWRGPGRRWGERQGRSRPEVRWRHGHDLRRRLLRGGRAPARGATRSS